MQRWMSTTLPWFLSLSLHVGGFLVLTQARSGHHPDERAQVWAGNTFEVETLSERMEPVSPATPAAPAESPTDVVPVEADADRATPGPEPPPEQSNDRVETPAPPAPVDPESAPELEARPAPAPTGAPSPTPSALAAAPGAAPPARGSRNVPSVAAPSSPPAAPVHGETGMKPEAVSLAKALTRACPRAGFPDKAWHRLQLGAAGAIEFAVELDDEGKVVRATRKKDPASPPPEHLLRLVQRMTRMLKSGVFAMTQGRVEAGVQHFEVSAHIEQHRATDSVLAEPDDLRQIGRFVEPTRTRPGKADFTYNSGRRVVLTVRMLSD